MAIIETRKKLRVVIDTNVIISSLIQKESASEIIERGAPFKIMERFRQNHFVMYINGHLMEEYDKKINQLIGQGVIKDPSAAGSILNDIRGRAVSLKHPIDPPLRCTDPKDNHVLEVALVGGLDYIVTDDSRDLFGLEGNTLLNNTKVINTETFIKILNIRTKGLTNYMATIDDFQKLDIRVGKIVAAEDFPEAKKPAYKLTIDFGPEVGMKRSSAQITNLYTKEELIGKTVLGVVNFPPRKIGPFESEVLTLGVPDEQGNVILITPDKHSARVGGKLF